MFLWDERCCGNAMISVVSSKCSYHSSQTHEAASCLHSKKNNEHKFLFNKYLASAGPCAKGFTFALPFHPHSTIIISVLHTRKLWLERFSNLSQGHTAQCRKQGSSSGWYVSKGWALHHSMNSESHCQGPVFWSFRSWSVPQFICTVYFYAYHWSPLCIVGKLRGWVSGRGILANFHTHSIF